MIICCNTSIKGGRKVSGDAAVKTGSSRVIVRSERSKPTSNKRLILMCGSKNPEISPKMG
eukprot:scaffold5864_cov93-Skeletonema_dohrnii-CCMP3373.AAC.1